MLQAKQNACEILLADIGYAAPSIWQIICKFDAAPWYDASPFAGKYIVASSQPLPADFQPCLAATISPLILCLPATVSEEDKHGLINNRMLSWSRVPAKWWLFPKETGEAIVAGLQKMFGSQVENFDELLSDLDSRARKLCLPCLQGRSRLRGCAVFYCRFGPYQLLLRRAVQYARLARTPARSALHRRRYRESARKKPLLSYATC